jgi:hypothetical protein
MRLATIAVALLPLVVAACGESPPQQASSGASPPIRTACTTPEQAGAKAQDITRKLVEARKTGAITQDEYAAFNTAMSNTLAGWSEKQDLKAYCAALERIATDAELK